MKYQNILEDHKVQDIIITDYDELDTEDTLGKAVKQLQHISKRGFVIKSRGEYKGILTQKDLITGLEAYGTEGKIEDSMNNNIESVTPEMDIFEAFKHMRKNKYDIAPVLKNDAFKGILDIDNINEFFMIRKALQ